MPFEAGGIAHLSALLATALAAVLLVLAGRKGSISFNAALSRTVAAVLLLNFAVYFIYRVQAGLFDLRYDLPFQFCDWATFVSVWALLSKKRLAVELAWCGSLAGTLQGLITPVLPYDFPHLQYFTFFISHGLLVANAFYLTFGLKNYLDFSSALRVFKWSQVYFVTAIAVNYIFDANYGFLAQKPVSGSLLDLFGPWPWYLFVLQAVGLFMYSLFVLPFECYFLYAPRLHKKLKP